jgi:hypothetical protein
MWEEHPEYQKQQARWIGLGIAALIVLYIVFAVIHHDWDLLGQVLLFVADFAMALGLVFGFVWLVVKIFTTRNANKSKSKDGHKA